MSHSRILIVGNPAPNQLGAHWVEAAKTLGIEAALADTRTAYAGPVLVQKMAWWFRGHRPASLAAFSRAVMEEVRTRRPSLVLTTGLAPIERDVLDQIRRTGATVVNFLTDDPWNATHRAPWFLRALPAYDVVFSPRSANLDELRRVGVARVEYLPFAYNPSAHFFEPAMTPAARALFRSDVLLAGGADKDRVHVVTPLVEAGLQVALYGGYWDRFQATRSLARGFLDATALRHATAEARTCLGLVRRANRDGHSMRTFEVPAMRGCLLAEDTEDHRRLFGKEGDAVLYFRGPDDVVSQTRWLLGHPSERAQLVERAHALVTRGGHTYADRLTAMLEAAA